MLNKIWKFISNYFLGIYGFWLLTFNYWSLHDIQFRGSQEWLATKITNFYTVSALANTLSQMIVAVMLIGTISAVRDRKAQKRIADLEKEVSRISALLINQV